MGRLKKYGVSMAVYEEYQPRTRWQAAHLADMLPWRSIIAPGVVLQKHRHALQRTYAIRGPDLQGETKEVQGAIMLQANDVLKRLGGRWMIQSEAQRRRVTALPHVPWRHAIPRLIDARRRATLLDYPGSRTTDYYLTLTWTPPAPSTRRSLGFFLHGPAAIHAENDAQVSLREFVEQADYFIGLLKGVLAVARPLTTPETLTYLHNCVSDRWHTVAHLASLADIDLQLCDTRLLGGWYPQLGAWHIRTCSVTAYPASSMVGVMRDLDAADVDYRWCTRWIGLEKHIQAGILRKTQGTWVGEERSFWDRFSENITHQPTRILNSDATNKAEDVDAARQDIGADLVAYGEFTSTVTVWDPDALQADQHLSVVREALEARGFVTTAEDKHAVAAWLSTHPGNRLDNVRHTTQHSLTLAHLCPGLTAAWPGPERDTYLQGGPWFFAHTERNTLFRVVNHLRDLGHFLLLGTTGSGKSTLGNFMRAMWMQYDRAQAKVFDVDGHARLLTYLLGGYWYDLGSPTLRLQPLRTVNDPLRQELLLGWLLDILTLEQVAVNAYTQMYVRSALTLLAQRPANARTWEEFLRLLTAKPEGYLHEVHNHRIRVDVLGVGHEDVHLRQLDQLKAEVRWTFGRYATVFGGDSDTLPAHPVQTFELRSLTQQSHLLGPMIRYIMLEVSEQMTTDAPMFLLLDDAAIAWLAPKGEKAYEGVRPQGRATMEDQANDWLQTTRKKGVSLGVSTHSAEKVLQSPLGQIIIESCKHRFYLANPGAMEMHIHAVYAEMGLTDTAIQTIATARPQRDVYYAHEELGQRLFHLPLDPLTLACLARNTDEDHAMMDRLLATEGREGFAAAWLRSQGFTKEADDVDTHQTVGPGLVGSLP
jgi:type IV secretory pathway VirB4 component